ncbi:hypothetical protein N7522_008450 [Penicillium canescens]|uniref:uncharacterized protein n=1 Tax=Penicillium canescens TaxID=5083 RepID=UPI0026E03927|nr:uncharacterized protein N7446_002583 [Penicillium canescens]KAJ5996790.1 hypothetical protein N7522_008450 [Penicillium canescens]KAJ6055859.1 hypothetical protein N7444_004957 [Penicillium canescens]KAJ6074806.1 hypothetical protein N7446_002583 [Penicillium canescens]
MLEVTATGITSLKYKHQWFETSITITSILVNGDFTTRGGLLEGKAQLDGSDIVDSFLTITE